MTPPGEKIHLIEQTCGAIESAFCADDAKKLNSIMSDWAKHTDEKQVKDALYALLRKCELGGRRVSEKGALELFPRAARSLENKSECHIWGPPPPAKSTRIT